MKTARKAVYAQLPPPAVFWLLAALLMVCIPHVARVPLLVTLFFLLLLSWRYLLTLRRWALPSRATRLLLTTLGVVMVYASYGTVVGRDAGVALLLTMLGIKLLEMAQQRDVYVTVLIAYFLVITNFLYSQSLATAFYMFFVVVVITGTLIEVNRQHFRTNTSTIYQNMRLAATLLAQALPIMVVLFVFFPRIASPLWGLPSDAFGAGSGLDDEMAPGEISNLIQSDEVAFRATFPAEPPAGELRYWRGPVFWHTDGRRWRAANPERPAVLTGAAPRVEKLGAPVRYTVTLEPHKRLWMYALDLPFSQPAGSRLTDDFQLHATAEVKQRLRYDMESYPEYRMFDLSAQERRRALQLPPGVNLRTAALGKAWRALFNDDAMIVQQALRMFRNEPFVYTLEPPLLNSDSPMDEFLFDTRRGFCEHYSSAFATLMRAAGVPTRVVLGYQGGEMNPVGGYMIVRQRDAHAWTEVWIEGQGWVRVDPTAAVAPERVERRVQLGDAAEGEPARFELPDNSLIRATLERLRFSADALNNGWNQWVLNYSQKQQEALLRGFGIESLQGMIVALGVGVLIILVLVATAILVRDSVPQDPALRAWGRFCRKLARRGIVRRASEGPRDFAARVSAARPELRAAAQHIAQLFIALRYAPASEERKAQLQALRREVRRFRA